MNVYTELSPAQIANYSIQKTGICKVRWTGSVPQSGILIKHPDSPDDKYRFLFIGYKTEIRIGVSFNERWHPRIELRENVNYVKP